MKTVIMAGGKGTRISAIANDVPKPMIKIAGKPILEHEIRCLKEQGFTDIIITVSYLGNIIMDYFGDGKNFGVNISYYYEKEPLGNAGALFKIKDQLTDVFLLLNADAAFNIDFNRFVNYHYHKGGIATLFTHPNSHPYDSGLLITDKTNCVLKWLTKDETRPKYYKNRVNAGIHVLDKRILDVEIKTEKIDLDKQLLKPLAGSGQLYCYDSPEYVKDMGTPERYYEVIDDFKNGIIESRNLIYKQKAIFLDRDGTINKYVGFLTDINEFKLNDDVAKAITKINNKGYLAIVITNQPVVARGEISIEELNEIHNKMETLLGKEGAYINAIYYCPHHPDKGYEGEVKKYKIKCNCRKPKAGMLLQAAKEYNIDLSKSWMIGDSENDIKAGKNAGCSTCLIGSEEYGQNITCNSLYEFVNKYVR